MMTIDDEGEGGVWPMMTSSQKSKIFRIFQGILPNFSLPDVAKRARGCRFTAAGQTACGKFFPKNFQIQDKNSQVNLNKIVSGLLQGKDD